MPSRDRRVIPFDPEVPGISLRAQQVTGGILPQPRGKLAKRRMRGSPSEEFSGVQHIGHAGGKWIDREDGAAVVRVLINSREEGG